MQKFILSLVFILSLATSFAQVRNINPDPNGEPWLVGGLRVPSAEELAKIPEVRLSETDLQRNINTLPSSLDNTTQPYFRPIFNQSDGSCAQSSGVAYIFTYEINRERNTSAASTQNQYPSHYTYNFLNEGSGNNGSWPTDGWNIIKANGCPNIPTYGGSLNSGGASRWMSGYNNYESSMDNRVKDYFSIDVSTPAGLTTLKNWMENHLEGAGTGSIVSFTGGVASAGFNITFNNIITSWGSVVDHAMAFVGWDDNISYDYNNDGQITNNVDINNDGVVDMKDWEQGALIMANTWGTSWANNGKAYVMYKTLAESTVNGGIGGNKVYAVRVKNTQTPQLVMRVKMTHNSRNKIKIMAGVSQNTTAAIPEHIIEFPLFNYQGGSFPMNGLNNTPIEISLDVSRLLNFVDDNTQATYYLIVEEDDPNNSSSGIISDFALVDSNNQVYTCNQHNVNIVNNAQTILSTQATIEFDKPEITTNSLPTATAGQAYSHIMAAQNGSPEYTWTIKHEYTENNHNDAFPNINTNTIQTDDDDDGFGSQTLDFDFPFYGDSYNDIYILTDGSIVFENGFDYLRNESMLKSKKAISVFASDLMIYPADGDGIFYEGDANHATFRWKTSLYDNQAANVDIAVTLYPNGDIKFFYGNNITNNLDWAAGISDGENNYIILSNSGDPNPSNDKIVLNTDPFPIGMSISKDGEFQGTAPNINDSWPIKFVVTDNNDVSDLKTLMFETEAASINENEKLQLAFYPNPVTDFATLSYELEENAQVKIEVFDLQGKSLAILLNDKQHAGKHQVIWQPHLRKGIYIVKVIVGNKETHKKIIIK